MAAKKADNAKWYDVLTLLGGLAICGGLILWLVSNPIIAQPPCPACPTPTPEPTPIPPQGITRNYVIQEGDTLWDISERKEHYNDPYLWPVIHWEASNYANIIDPDLILPNQQLVIRPITVSRSIADDDTRPRALLVNDGEIRDAENFARTRGPWSFHDRK